MPDGVYVTSADGEPTFVRAPGLSDDDVRQIVETTANREVRLWQRRGLLEGDTVDPLWEEEPLLATITAASVQGAGGHRAGQRVRRRLIDPAEGVSSGPLCFSPVGFPCMRPPVWKPRTGPGWKGCAGMSFARRWRPVACRSWTPSRWRSR